jgi:RNA polymerase sigma factor (sigma-70 family)
MDGPAGTLLFRVRFGGLWSCSLTHHSSWSAQELIRACAESNDRASWEELVSRFHRPISLSVIRTAHQWTDIPQQVVDDLVQETYLKLCTDRCRLLHAFAQEHPEAIGGYIKMIASNVAHDHFKALYSHKRGAGRDQESLSELDPAAGNSSLGSAEAIEQEILLKQIDDCLGNCAAGPDEERDRTIFWLHYQQGMSAKAIAALPAVGLTPKGVESAILRLTRLVRERMVQLRSESSGKEPGQKGFRPAESY